MLGQKERTDIGTGTGTGWGMGGCWKEEKHVVQIEKGPFKELIER